MNGIDVDGELNRNTTGGSKLWIFTSFIINFPSGSRSFFNNVRKPRCNESRHPKAPQISKMLDYWIQYCIFAYIFNSLQESGKENDSQAFVTPFGLILIFIIQNIPKG